MFARLLKTISVYFGANLFAKALNFLFFAWLSRLLSIEEMGEFSLLNMAVTILSLLMLLEMPSGFNRYYLDQALDEREVFENSIINFLLIVNAILVGGLIVIYAAFPQIFAVLPQDAWALGFILLIPFGNAVVSIYQTKMRLLQRATNVAWVMLVQSLGYIGTFFLLWQLGFSKLAALMGAFVGQNVFIVILRYKDFCTWRPTFRWEKIRECARFSVWLIPSSIGAYFSLLSGKYFLGRANMIREVGIYEGNNKVANTFQLVMEPIYMAVSPMYFARYKENSYRHFYLQTVGGIALLMLMVAIVTGCFAREIVWVILGEKYVAYYYYLYFFMGIAIFSFLARIVAVNIHLAQKSQYDTAIELFSGFLNCGLCFTVLVLLDGGLTELVTVITACYGIRLMLYLVVANHSFPKTAVPLFYGGVFVISGVAICFFNLMIQPSTFSWRIVVCMAELVGILWGAIYVGHVNLIDLLKR
ncbi:lipopolysaccharide biosynthesis protein [Selenomonas dianae]|uniref:Polysaccharide biosynthesis protein n=1 Tax=Selenomonas dianae TaxID=135079 RepID=A0ABN0SWE3_9FIRM|nr:oligosaccharide flippase family protein [Selenomonas dianae]WLD82860.1 oligosaccharide flippase family protein [Selenomonas dianae]